MPSRDEGGKFKDIQTYKRAHAADLRHKSKAEKEAAQGPIQKKVRKTANDAVTSIKSSVRGAAGRCGAAGGETRRGAGFELADGRKEDGEERRQEDD